MRKCIAVPVAATVATTLALLGGAPASADPRYRSIVTSVRPSTPGLSVSVTGYDENLRLVNRSSKPVTVFGYRGDAIGRVLADGAVQVNASSPSYRLNQERSGMVSELPAADPRAPAHWQTVNRTGVLTWHDHRMHWMGGSPPPAVRDTATRLKIWDYRVPIRVGTAPGNISGSLWWVGAEDSEPAWPFIVLGLVAAVLVVLIIRRRPWRIARADD